MGVAEVAMATNTRNMSATGNSVNASTDTAKASVELTTEVVSAVEKLEDLGECCASAKNCLLIQRFMVRKATQDVYMQGKLRRKFL